MDKPSDRDIIYLYRTGNSEMAIRLIIDTYGDQIYNVALFMLNDEDLAKDATQDVFIRIMKGLKSFQSKAQLKTWIYRITKNVCYDYLKKQSINKVTDLFNWRVDYTVNTVDDNNPETGYGRDWIHNSLRSAVLQLPVNQRMVLTLHYFQSLTYEDIATIMNLSMGTVKSHIYRGKQKLKQILKPILKGDFNFEKK